MIWRKKWFASFCIPRYLILNHDTCSYCFLYSNDRTRWWSDYRNGLVRFKSQGIWFIFLSNRITENNMNTEQFSFLFVLVLFKSQVILLVLPKSQGIWSFERNGLVLFKSQGSWWFFIIYYSISIEWQKIIWTQNNFSPCLFWFFLNPKLFNWFFLNPTGFDLK